ncbi:TA system antitoxin ParD family protein [Polynucleobacter necessarius]|uniref:TA system antitoxin ParD family protein n=1 Tax=Polynucleobacter necessarius TaxID=576610 RepID=UPI000E092381|nr:hypothetical protein [Polynucleobacter necessarius]
MPSLVKLSKALVKSAQLASVETNRTLSEQIEYWARLGKASEENPDLTVLFLQDILASQADLALNNLSKFRF